jgi:hypothetical protein
MVKSLWSDETGAVLSMELILIMVLVVIGSVAGLTALRDIMNAKLAEISAAMAAIDPGYGFGGLQYIAGPDLSTVNTAGGAWVAGSMFSSRIAENAATGAFEPIAVLQSDTVTPDSPPIITSVF